MKINNEEELRKWIEKNLLVKKEIIEKFGVNPSYFDVSVSRSKLEPFVRKGRINMYLKSDIEKFVKEHNKQKF